MDTIENIEDRNLIFAQLDELSEEHVAYVKKGFNYMERRDYLPFNVLVPLNKTRSRKEPFLEPAKGDQLESLINAFKTTVITTRVAMNLCGLDEALFEKIIKVLLDENKKAGGRKFALNGEKYIIN